MMLSVNFSHRIGTKSISAQLEIDKGVCAIFGPSGAGKTTLLNAIAGFLKPDSGHISLSSNILFDHRTGQNMPPHKRSLGVVFQDLRLFPHLNVAQNLSYAGKGRDDNIIDMLGLGALLTRQIATLSGGEKARVALGRAILSQPNALLLDEPLAALDMARREEIMPYFEALRDHTQIPIIYVSHSMEEVARLANKIVIMRAGHMVAHGAAKDLLRDPKMVQHFGIREMGALIEARVSEVTPDGFMQLDWGAGPVCLPDNGAKTGDQLRLRILAHNVILARLKPTEISAQNILPAQVISIDKGEGPGALVQLKCGAADLLARVTSRAVDQLRLSPGVDCFALIKATTVARSDISRHDGPANNPLP